MEDIDFYIKDISKPIFNFYIENKSWFDIAHCPRKSAHPDNHKQTGGLKIHTLQVIKKALELNQEFDDKEIIECCLIHDIKGCEKLPLTERQRVAIQTTKGLPYEEWRKNTPEIYKFVVLILIADMWSAFINVKNE